MGSKSRYCRRSDNRAGRTSSAVVAEVGRKTPQPSKSLGVTRSRQTTPAIRTWTTPPRSIGARNSAARACCSAAANRSRVSRSRFDEVTEHRDGDGRGEWHVGKTETRRKFQEPSNHYLSVVPPFWRNVCKLLRSGSGSR